MANSEKIFGCCNVFSLAKGLTITEIVLVVLTLILGFIGGIATGGSVDVSPLGILIHVAYLVTEYIGIHKKNKCLIIFGCIYRVLDQIFVVISIIHVFNSDICQLNAKIDDYDCETLMYVLWLFD